MTTNWSGFMSSVENLLGIPYLYGGITTLGFDCSGFTQYVYQQFAGINIGRTTTQQLQSGTPVGQDGNFTLDQSLLQAGDLIFYGQPGASGPNAHVVMYVGNNQVVQAGGTNVNRTTLFQQAGPNEPFLGVRRYTSFTGAPFGSNSSALAGPAGNTAAPSLGNTVQAQLTSAASSIGLTENELVAYLFFIMKGLSPAQSAGIVGNLMQESGVNPESQQNGGGPGRGIAQWTTGLNWNPALMTGNASADLLAQLDFLWSDLNGNESGALAALRGVNDPAAAAAVFSNQYERPAGTGSPGGAPSIPNRQANALQVFGAVQNTSSATLASWTGWLEPIIAGLAPGAAAGISAGVGGLESNALNSLGLGGLATVVNDIASPSFWSRILIFGGGLVLAGVGLAIFLSTTEAGKTVESGAVSGAALAAAA